MWTWTAIDADTKLIASWLVGSRDAGSAYEFMQDVASRSRPRAAHDGRPQALSRGGRGRVRGGHRLRRAPEDVRREPADEKRYSPAVCIGCKCEIITGSPDPKHISTRYVERQNLTMRMSMRRFTRLTNAFSKKVENHAAAIALYFMYYNFGRMHQTLRVTPAMEAAWRITCGASRKSSHFSAREAV